MLSASPSSHVLAKAPLQRQTSGGNDYFDNLARQIREIIQAAPGRNDELAPTLERLNNDSSHILSVRNSYWSLFQRNLVFDVMTLLPPRDIRWDPIPFANYKKRLCHLLNMTYSQAEMHAHGEINKISDEREDLHDFRPVTGEDRDDIDADGRSSQGREQIMGVEATERDGIPIRGNTGFSYFNINSVPNWNNRNVVLGRMDGTEIPVTVMDKALFPNNRTYSNFYKVRFQDPGKYNALVRQQKATLTRKRQQGTISSEESYALDLMNQQMGWIVDAGIDMAMPWELFLRQVFAFDAAYADRSLQDRVTILRQMAHAKDLPFDQVIGSGGGSMYVDTRPDMGGLFQLLKDSGRVELPTGQIVDIYHAIVGMDVLYRPIEDHSISQFFISVDVGQNYSAATWAGDIGAAAVDAALGVDETWEANNTAGLTGNALLAARMNHYYDTRAPEADLWGNIDAWGMAGYVAHAPAPTRVADLFATYYGVPQDAGNRQKAGEFAGRRKQALTTFLKHYGARSIDTIQSDLEPVLVQQIDIFADTWDLYRRQLRAGGDPPNLNTYIIAMANVFGSWLQRQARNYNVQL